MFRVTCVKFQPVISLAVKRMQWKLELYVLQASVYFMFLDIILSPWRWHWISIQGKPYCKHSY